MLLSSAAALQGGAGVHASALTPGKVEVEAEAEAEVTVTVSVPPSVLPAPRYASRAVQLHPRPTGINSIPFDGDQFDSVWLPARTPHVGPQYMW